ncbi:MAG: Uma2 family endonuclease [Thermoanaerobaculia bacterium]
MDPLHREQAGPFFADQIGEEDYYELSNGHPIECSPAGRDHSAPNVSGAEVLDTDPDVEWSGIDAGFSPEPKTLRAPDVAVGKPAGEGPGWIPGAPPLAVEYASVGQDEDQLQDKIRDLLAGGTRFVWVVRLVGLRRVEVYEPDQPVRTLTAEEELRAPGVLRNPVPVKALYDRQAAHQVTLRNLLQRQGYENLEAVRTEGRVEGRTEGRTEGERHGVARSILTFLEARGLHPGANVEERILGCTELEVLRRWLVRAATIATSEDLFAEDPADLRSV